MASSTLSRFAIQSRLSRAPNSFVTIYATIVAFCTYFCMYAFRKPFAAGHYEGLKFLGTTIDLKTAFVISQILGYTFSKFVGIKLCSEANRFRRVQLLIASIVWAELALLLFAVIPGPWKVAAIFLNGFSLGMVWGLVVGYLEGRRTSEIQLVGLSCSFIIASGVVKDVGKALMTDYGITEWWMPFVTGLVFLPGFLLFSFLLHQVPEPSDQDIVQRVKREPMDARRRWAFMRQFFAGIVLLLVFYFFLTAYRDFRDNYMVDIFQELGFAEDPAIMTSTELPVAFGVMIALASLNLIKRNRTALVTTFAIMTLGVLLLGGGTLLLDAGLIRGDRWMVLTGLGTYLAYVPYGSILFDRIVASTRVVATAVFTIMLADAVGYTGATGVQLYKDLVQTEATRLDFFRHFSYAIAAGGAILLILSSVYFLRKSQSEGLAAVRPEVQPDDGQPSGGEDATDDDCALAAS